MAASDKPSHISQENWDAVDVPEATEADFARAKPFSEVFPEAFASWKNKGGRPAIGEQPKVHIGFRLAAEVVEAVRASGKGYNARVEAILRDAMAKGMLGDG